MMFPILPLGTMFVTDELGDKQSGYKVPFFSKIGLTSLLVAYARPYLFLFGLIPAIALLNGAGWWAGLSLAALGALWLYFMSVGAAANEGRYRQLLLGFATGAAAEPEWLQPASAANLTKQLEATHRELFGQAELAQTIRARSGDIRQAAVSYSLARYRALSDQGAAELARQALAWAQALLALEGLEQRVVTPAGRIRGLSVEVSNSGVMLGDKRVFANSDGASGAASLLLLSDAGLELGFLDRAGVELAMKQLLSGGSPAQALGAGARTIALADVQSVEYRQQRLDLTLHYRAGDQDASCVVWMADLEQRAGLLEALKSALGSRFVEAQKPAKALETVLAGGFMLFVVGLLWLLFWNYGIGKAVTLLGLAASCYWIVNRLRNPPLVTCVERRNTPSIAPAE